MRNLLTILFLCLLFGCQKELLYKKATSFDGIKVNLITDTTINSVWDGGGKVLRIEDRIIHGTGTLRNWIIDAPYTQQIVDSSINFVGCQTYNNVFSVAWLGAKESNTDNWWNIQKSINTCLANKMSNCYVPGRYSYSKTLDILSMYNGDYSQAELHFYGNAAMWDQGWGSTLNYTSKTGMAFNMQINKGSEIDHLIFRGQFKAPVLPDSLYYNLTQAQFNNGFADNYMGFVIDGRTPIRQTGGSTGLNIHDITVSNFTRDIVISPNGVSFNADILLFKNIHVGDASVAITTSQAQEKGNVIDGLYSWGSVHTIVSIGHYGKYQAGDYTFSNANIAGKPIRCFDISIGHWFSTKIDNWFVESIGYIGDFSAQMPITISNSTFNCNYNINKKRILVNSNSSYVSFNNSTIRYYDGLINDVYVHGGTYNNVYFGGGKLIYQ